ncbi:ArnT family glycosyltransferase [Halotia branconii]|uniref:Glycosyltransferase family 39 protein n=1 Tax=Halotia branconii CENA392 TaxID=1539056 RepID=A0AAJ6NNJ1_9CYAN|nr:glycosyltransferase family 39 protein [Halotia branconii]WGV23794.1 glycosyltransferase family 39 protein [Halotia branconii CENA392]
MLYRLHSWRTIWRQIYLSSVFPYVSLLIWTLPLLLFSSGQNSLMAHDEGLYAWRARQMFDSGDWIAPWGNVHHKTPGPYWLIAIAYKLFGISENSVRITSIIAGIFSLLLVYEIGKIILSKKLGWLAAAILSVEFLWLQYCRLGTPDVPMIFLILLAIWSLIKAELNFKYRYLWSFIAGLSLSLGFLVRSFMIFLPMMALLPYLIGEHRRHRHLANPMLYVGFAIGLIPTLGWLWFNWLRFGNASFAELFRFVFQLGTHERGGNGIIFYFWNVPAKSFPWSLLSILGLVLVFRHPIPRYHLLLAGFPLVLFAELSIFSTRLSHYSLSLYPFIAFLAAVGLDWLSKIYQRGITKNIPRNLSYAFGVLGVLLLLAGIGVFVWGDAKIRDYAILGLIVGLSWLILPAVWIARYHLGMKFFTARYWVAGWLIPCWLALAIAGNLGLLGNYNSDVKTFIQKPAIASIVQTHPIYFVQVGGKTAVLLNFYTPVHGKKVDSISQVPVLSYAWVSPEEAAKLSIPYRVLGTVQKHLLIQVM